jgi:hypothetical protein
LLTELTKYAPEELFIDPSVYFARYIKEDLQKQTLACKTPSCKTSACQTSQTPTISPSPPSDKFYVSADPENFVRAGRMFYEIEQVPELFDLHDLAVK